MHIDSIYAGPVALAHAFALASRANTASDDSRNLAPPNGVPRRRLFRPLQRLAQWWRGLDTLDSPTSDPVQLMLWSECWGRPYSASLGPVLLMNHSRRNAAKKLP